MTFKKDKALEFAAKIAKEAGSSGIPKEEFWSRLDKEELTPDSFNQRGQLVLGAKLKKFGKHPNEVYVHRDLAKKKRQTHSVSGHQEHSFDLKNGTVHIKDGTGLDVTLTKVEEVSIRRKK